MGELGDSFRSAYIAVSRAYINTTKLVAKCNTKTNAALREIEEAEMIYDNRVKSGK